MILGPPSDNLSYTLCPYPALFRSKGRRPRTARGPRMGVRRKLSGTTLGSIAPLRVIDARGREGRKLGFESAELSWILEENLPIIHLIESVGGRRYKTYRIYGKPL